MPIILRSQIKDEAALRDALQHLIDLKLKHLDTPGSMPPVDAHLEPFIKRTPQGDPYPDKFEMDYEIVDDTPPEPAEVVEILNASGAIDASN